MRLSLTITSGQAAVVVKGTERMNTGTLQRFPDRGAVKP